MLNYWVITDTHFGHHKMRDYCQRPKGFEETILKNLRSCVKPDDVLIHLGDICIYHDEDWHSAMRGACDGKWWLVRGNHDRKSLGWYLSHGWDFVANGDRDKKCVLIPIVGTKKDNNLAEGQIFHFDCLNFWYQKGHDGGIIYQFVGEEE